MNRRTLMAAAALLLLAACKEEVPAPLYEPVPVERRDITVSAEAAGTIEPILIVDVKSKASGEIIELNAETGDIVRQGELLVRVDPRDPNNAVAQAQADLEVARAQLANAEAAKRRSDEMFAARVLSEQEHEAAGLSYANARAQLVRAERTLQTARDQLDDTSVRAPITGTIIAKNVERGNVITSATREVSGGTVLLRMADLNEVQVRTLVDETDIGKISADMPVSITVDAFPNRPFQGRVLKIEPQSVTSQNVTMFPVLIRIANEQGLLRPGMNAEVEINVARRTGVLAIPNAALRTTRDVASAATVLGLDPRDVDLILARADSQRPPETAQVGRPGGQTARRSDGQRTAAPAAPESARSFAGRTPDPAPARTDAAMALPPGVTQEQAMALFQKRRTNEPFTAADSALSQRIREFRQQQGMSGGGAGGGAGGGVVPSGGTPAGTPAATGEAPAASGAIAMDQMGPLFAKVRAGQTLTAAEQALMTRFRSQVASPSGTRRRFGAGNNFQFGGSYIVFVLRNGQPEPVRIRTGVTDLDYSEVSSGLTEQDTVLLLPSASLINSQTEMRERFQRMTGGGGLPGMKQQTPSTTTPGATGGSTGGPPAGGRPGGN